MPDLKFYNTLSGRLEAFKPLSGNEVKMYNCGPTVYGTQHIGNMRAAVFADTIRRTLLAWDYTVKQVINITDFGHLSGDNEGNADEGEDRMTRGLRREGMELTMDNMHALATRYMEAYFADIDALGVDRTHIQFPRASAYVPDMVRLVQTLEEKGYAYRTSQGVYFEVARFPTYGKLGNINLEGQLAGARVAGHEEKRGPFDFILWKSDPNIGWESPWGRGFPGWHIECTAMIFALLGKQIDIHTGGIEHIPVHHNNEIAQAEAATGKQYVTYWLHNDHITIDGKKISKSLGNTVYVDDIVAHGGEPRSLRYWFHTAHYRSQANFTWEAFDAADTALKRLARLYHELPPSGLAPNQSFLSDLHAALADDLDTPRAVARIWELVKDSGVTPAVKKNSLAVADGLLGLGLSYTAQHPRRIAPSDLPAEARELLAEREAARAAKDYAKSDELRDRLAEAGFEVKDTPNGQEIRRR